MAIFVFVCLLIISQTGCEKKDGESAEGSASESETSSESAVDVKEEVEESYEATEAEPASDESVDYGESVSFPEGVSEGDGEALDSPITKEGFYLDTICRITIYALAGDKSPDSVIEGAFGVCKELEGQLSKTIETSDIYKLNHAGEGAVTFGEHSFNCLADGLNYGYFSDGDFNIGIGPITELWDFHAEDPKVPDEKAIENALKNVLSISVDSTDEDYFFLGGEDVELPNPEARIDLGGLAKGYIADRISEYLITQGVTGAVIDLGGNIVVIGYKDGKVGPDATIEGSSDITVGIKLPYTTTDEIVGAIPLHNASVVTSGVYERYFEVDGKKYHHILDPKTGYPVDTSLDSITVVGEMGRSEDCDALATIILLKGEDWLREKLKEEEGMSEMERMTSFVALSDFTFVLIRNDGSIETLGSSAYSFNPM